MCMLLQFITSRHPYPAYSYYIRQVCVELKLMYILGWALLVYVHGVCVIQWKAISIRSSHIHGSKTPEYGKSNPESIRVKYMVLGATHSTNFYFAPLLFLIILFRKGLHVRIPTQIYTVRYCVYPTPTGVRCPGVHCITTVN